MIMTRLIRPCMPQFVQRVMSHVMTYVMIYRIFFFSHPFFSTIVKKNNVINRYNKSVQPSIKIIKLHKPLVAFLLSFSFAFRKRVIVLFLVPCKANLLL